MGYKFNPFTGNLDNVGAGGGGGATNLDGLTDVTITTPSAWQVLGYNTTSGEWENTSHIHGGLAGSVYIHIKNTDSVQLDKGTPFYITGTVGASDQVEVQAADSADPLKGPAVGLVEEDLAVNGEGNGVIIGEIFQFDTATPGWSTNDALYVANTGGLTNVQPTSGYRQVVAYVGRVHATTGTLVLTGANVDPVAGSNGQVQFNDNGGFGGDAGLTYDKTTDKLTVGGDIDLDDGGTFSTTLQTVTPTANRTVSIPDATGTIALVNGPTGSIQFNEAGALNGTSDFTVNVDWDNPATTFTALKVNVPDALQGAADSNLLDLQVGGTSLTRILASGAISTSVSGGSGAPSIGSGTTGFYFSGPGGELYFTTGGTYRGAWRSGILSIARANSLAWESSGAASLNDLYLYRDAANTLAQRNGTAAQTFRLYNTYTDASNYERGFLQWNSNVLEIGSEGAGTGSEQPVRITAATLKLPNLPTYADNTAATSGGLVAGDVYKTATGELRITV